MTNEEALWDVTHYLANGCYNGDNSLDYDTLILSQMALSKQIKRKPESQHHCPCCGSGLPVPELTIPEARQYIEFYPKFCPDCGQAIAWKGETK